MIAAMTQSPDLPPADDEWLHDMANLALADHTEAGDDVVEAANRVKLHQAEHTDIRAVVDWAVARS